MKKILILSLCALFIMPSAYAGKRKVAIVAHRGYWKCEAGGQAHNSIASLKSAQTLKVWGSEFDVNMTSDGELLVFHDGSVKVEGYDKKLPFQTNPASVFKTVRLVNGETIPTLDEYLDQFTKGKKTRLVFELKDHKGAVAQRQAVELSVRKLKEHGLFDPQKVIFISFNMNQCRIFSQMAPGFTVQYLGSDMDPDAVAENGINGIDTNYKTFYKEGDWYSKAKAHGMKVNVWTVDNEEDIRNMIEMGADYITTNEPELVRSILKDMHVKELKCGKNF